MERDIVHFEEIAKDAIDIEFRLGTLGAQFTSFVGEFVSPASDYLAEEAQIVRIEVILPATSTQDAKAAIAEYQNWPLVILCPATGDEGFSIRRSKLAIPLLKKGIISVLVQICYYGSRRSKEYTLLVCCPALGLFLIRQTCGAILTLENLHAQMFASIWECLSIFRFFRSNLEWLGAFGIAGISFGGSCAAMTSLLASFDIKCD